MLDEKSSFLNLQGYAHILHTTEKYTVDMESWILCSVIKYNDSIMT